MKELTELPKNVYDRLEYLEFMLRFRGWVSRSDLTEKFGLGEAAASRDIRMYKDYAHDNMELDQSTKKYRICDTIFTPIFNTSVQTVFSRIRKSDISMALGMSTSDGILSPPRLSLPSIDNVSTITRAIFSGLQLNTNYGSIGSGISNKQLIPHAIFDNGIHWYMRAFDLAKKEFRSYALTRIISVDIDKEAPSIPSLKNEDHQWNRMVTLELAPHSNRKNVRNPETVEHDFNMKDGILKIVVRAAIAGYWLHHWTVDCTEDASLEGYDYQLRLKNHQTLYDVESRGIAPGLSEYHNH